MIGYDSSNGVAGNRLTTELDAVNEMKNLVQIRGRILERNQIIDAVMIARHGTVLQMLNRRGYSHPAEIL